MRGAFTFVEGGRSYTCQVEEPRDDRREAWWWFRVSGDDNRYAPFRADVGDTQASVHARVVAYYEDRLARRTYARWQTRGSEPVES